MRRLVPALAVTGGLLALLWWRAGFAEALGLLAGARPGWLLAALAALGAQTLLSAWRWRLTSERLGQTVRPGRAIAEYYLAQIVNQSLPGGVLGDAGRALRAGRHAGRDGIWVAGQAVLLERLSGQVALLAVLALAAGGTALGVWGPRLPAGWAAAGAVVAVAALGGLALLVWRGPALPGAAGRALADLRRSARLALLARQAWPAQAALSLAGVALNLTAFAFCACATGIALTPAETAVLVPPIILAMLMPLTISGWGAREAVAAAALPLVGASPASALAASTAFGLVFLLSALPGALVPLRAARAKKRPPACPAPADP